ncbi:hypothetical protein FB451DRAFT_1509709 [Mycena latifolia]|nr:hypothetical protein FB451DRAFT_1509709 [Mycena latifolia]
MVWHRVLSMETDHLWFIKDIRIKDIVTSLGAAAITFNAVSESLKTPFLKPISNTLHSLLTAVQTVERNQDECIQMLEQIYEILYGVIWLHIKSDTSGELSPMITLHKVHTFVEAEQEKSKIKQFFRQGEMRTLLKACHRGLEQALPVFKIQGATVLSDVAEMQQHAQKTHQEVLELISALSEGSSESGSSIRRALSTHNRHLVPRIAILGGEGMGKTSLARAVLHHPKITARYDQNCVFVACDATSSSIQLAALIGVHVGLKPGSDLIEAIVWYFRSRPPSLLILDNLETVWEPKESCADVEKFLALLKDIEHLALITISDHNAWSQKANVRWTHPLLEPLKPLAQEAARKTFIDIVDDSYAVEEIDRILSLADNMPLAIDFMAHLVDYDGFESVVHNWEIERMSLLSEGHNKGSNLDLSISMSLESPRLASVPHTCALLSLLSMLPDGLAEADLLQSRLPIENILACKAALLRTSLAYTDDQKQLKALVPIREYMQKMHPPMACVVQPFLKHFNDLLEIHETYHGTVSSSGIVVRITSNFANIQNVLHNPAPNAENLVNQILEHLPQFEDPDLKCSSYANNDIPRGTYYAQSGLSLSISTGYTKGQGDILATLAWIKWRAGDYLGSWEHAYESRMLARISGNLFMEAYVLRFESMCWNTLGSYNKSIILANRARDLLSLCAMSGGQLDTYILSTQAEVHLLKSEYVAACTIHTQLLHTAQIDQSPFYHASVLLTMAQIDVEIGALIDGVVRNLDTAKQLFSNIKQSRGILLCDVVIAALEVNVGDLPNAMSLFQACLKYAWGQYTDAVSYCLEELGNTTLWVAMDHPSYNWTVTFLVHSLRSKRKLEIHKALQFLGDVYLENGDKETAVSLFTVALEGFTKMDVHCSRAECMLRLGNISEIHGDLTKAAELWKTARPLFERSSQAKQVSYIDTGWEIQVFHYNFR